MALEGADVMGKADVSVLSDSKDKEALNKAKGVTVTTAQPTVKTTKSGIGLNPSSYNYAPSVSPQYAANNVALEGDQLLQAVKYQIEFYLSASNLERDVYLCSLMDTNHFVQLKQIMEFKKLRSLTTDDSVVIQAISNSTTCSLNEERTAVRANFKQEAKRNTIVLREISSGTSPEVVRAIFIDDGCGEVLSVRSDVGDIWFVTMKTEDEARKTLIALLSKEFDGKPIKARLKNESMYKSYYNVSTAPGEMPPDATSPLLQAQSGYMLHNIPPLGYFSGNSQMPYNSMSSAPSSPNRYANGKRGTSRSMFNAQSVGPNQNRQLPPFSNAQTQTQHIGNPTFLSNYKSSYKHGQRGMQSTYPNTHTNAQTQTHIHQDGGGDVKRKDSEKAVYGNKKKQGVQANVNSKNHNHHQTQRGPGGSSNPGYHAHGPLSAGKTGTSTSYIPVDKKDKEKAATGNSAHNSQNGRAKLVESALQNTTFDGTKPPAGKGSKKNSKSSQSQSVPSSAAGSANGNTGVQNTATGVQQQQSQQAQHNVQPKRDKSVLAASNFPALPSRKSMGTMTNKEGEIDVSTQTQEPEAKDNTKESQLEGKSSTSRIRAKESASSSTMAVNVDSNEGWKKGKGKSRSEKKVEQNKSGGATISFAAALLKSGPSPPPPAVLPSQNASSQASSAKKTNSQNGDDGITQSSSKRNPEKGSKSTSIPGDCVAGTTSARDAKKSDLKEAIEVNGDQQTQSLDLNAFGSGVADVKKSRGWEKPGVKPVVVACLAKSKVQIQTQSSETKKGPSNSSGSTVNEPSTSSNILSTATATKEKEVVLKKPPNLPATDRSHSENSAAASSSTKVKASGAWAMNPSGAWGAKSFVDVLKKDPEALAHGGKGDENTSSNSLANGSMGERRKDGLQAISRNPQSSREGSGTLRDSFSTWKRGAKTEDFSRDSRDGWDDKERRW